MNREQVRAERDRALARVLRHRFITLVDDISLRELFELFVREDVSAASEFKTYHAFRMWVQRRGAFTLLHDSQFGGRVAAVTGRPVLHTDGPASRETSAEAGVAFMPFGDFSYCLDPEAVP